MADAILGHRRFDGKPTTTTFTISSTLAAALAATASSGASIRNGLVQHDYLDADSQLAILATIDETGSAPLEDIVAALPGHPKPAGAALAMVAAGILAIDSGIVDANIRLRRALPPGSPGNDEDGAAAASAAPRPQDNNGGAFASRGAGGPTNPPVREVVVPLFAPAIFCSRGADRARLGREPLLARPGVYVAVWGSEVYIGASSNVCRRVAKGNHLVTPVPADRIIAIVDRSGQLSWDEAQVAERLLYRGIEDDGALKPRNGVPSGGAIDATRYGLVHDFVETALVALREAKLLVPSEAISRGNAVRPAPRTPAETPAFKTTSPSAAPGTYRLDACGVEALARVQGDTWTVLAGSGIRSSVMPSAHPSAGQRRIELLHSGGLVRHGGDYLLTRDLTFNSATGAAHFVVGSKTRADIWEAVDAAPSAALQH